MKTTNKKPRTENTELSGTHRTGRFTRDTRCTNIYEGKYDNKKSAATWMGWRHKFNSDCADDIARALTMQENSGHAGQDRS
jgi:hypothetical protein